MNNLDKDSLDSAKEIAKNTKLPPYTLKSVYILKELNLTKFRKLLKKERANLPPKFKKLYRADEAKLTRAMHYLRTVYPYFSKEEVLFSQNFLSLQQKILDGMDALSKQH